MMGGGRAFFMNATRNGKRTDGRNIDFAWERLGGRRKVLRSVDDLWQYDVSKGGKVLGGLIDVGQHLNSMHKTFAEMEAFEDAIRQAREMTDPSETLILVTSDHAHALTIPGYALLNESIFGNYKVDEHSVPSMFFALGPGYRGGFRTEQLDGDPSNPMIFNSYC
ncbi:hypothetical protein COOONC_05428 [Cooperia oncophora]